MVQWLCCQKMGSSRRYAAAEWNTASRRRCSIFVGAHFCLPPPLIVNFISVGEHAKLWGDLFVFIRLKTDYESLHMRHSHGKKVGSSITFKRLYYRDRYSFRYSFFIVCLTILMVYRLFSFFLMEIGMSNRNITLLTTLNRPNVKWVALNTYLISDL